MLPLHIYNNTQQAQVLRAWTRSFWPLNAMLVSRTEADLKFWSQGIGFVASGTVSQPLTWRNCCCYWWWGFLGFFCQFVQICLCGTLQVNLRFIMHIKAAFCNLRGNLLAAALLLWSFNFLFTFLFAPRPVAEPVSNSAVFAERPILHRLYQKRNIWWMTPRGTPMAPSEYKL